MLVILESKTGYRFGGWYDPETARKVKKNAKERGLHVSRYENAEEVRGKNFRIVKAFSPDIAYLKKHPEIIFLDTLKLVPTPVEYFGSEIPTEVLPENWL